MPDEPEEGYATVIIPSQYGNDMEVFDVATGNRKPYRVEPTYHAEDDLERRAAITEGHEPDCPCKYCKMNRLRKKSLEADSTVRYDYTQAYDIYFNQTKPDGKYYSLGEVGPLCNPPLPTPALMRHAAKNKWHPQREALLKGIVKTAQLRTKRESQKAAQLLINAERRLSDRNNADASTRAAKALADLHTRWLDAVEDAVDEAGVKTATALGNLYRQTKTILAGGAPPAETDADDWAEQRAAVDRKLNQMVEVPD